MALSGRSATAVLVRRAGDGDVLEQRVAGVAEQLDVAGTLVTVLEAVIGEVGVDDVERGDAGNDRRVAVVVGVVADRVDAVLRIARDGAVDDGERAGIGGLLDEDAVGAAGDVEVVEGDVGAAEIARKRDCRAGGRVDVDLAEADQRQALGDAQAFGIGPRGDHDRVASRGGIDGGLDAREAAGSHEEHVAHGGGIAEPDDLDAAQGIGALVAVAGIDVGEDRWRSRRDWRRSPLDCPRPPPCRCRRGR